MSPISEFTNEIYDQDSLTDAFKEGADVWTIFLGVVVTLLPKVCIWVTLICPNFGKICHTSRVFC